MNTQEKTLLVYAASDATAPYSVSVPSELSEGLQDIVENAITEKYIGEYKEGTVAFRTMTEREYETLRSCYRRKLWERLAEQFDYIEII